MSNAKECGNKSGCFKESGQYKRLNFADLGYHDNYWDPENSAYNSLVLNDGVAVSFSRSFNECDSNNLAGSTNSCARIFLDINGRKNPNQLGRDFFIFDIKEDGLEPVGCNSNSSYCNPKGSGTRGFGETCACKVLKEGAMNY